MRAAEHAVACLVAVVQAKVCIDTNDVAGVFTIVSCGDWRGPWQVLFL